MKATKMCNSNKKAEFRKRAEERLQKTRDEVASMATEDVQELIYELQVHQIELEMRNDEIVQAQEETTMARDRYQRLYEFAPEGYITLDEDLVIREANEVAASLLGVSRRQLVGDRISRHAVSEDRDICYKYLREISTIKQPQKVEIRFEPKPEDRRIVQLQAKFSRCPIAGQVEIPVALTDITEEHNARDALRYSEQRYRFLYEQSQLTNVVLGLDGKITDINEAALRRMGYCKEEVIGQPLINFIVPAQRETITQWIDEVAHGGPAESIDIEVYDKDGSVRTFMTAAGNVMLYDNGNPSGMLFSASDITERKQLEEQLQQRARELAESNKELEAFAHSISHDLRNPLNNLLAMSDLLLHSFSEKLDKDGVWCVHEVERSAQRMSATISDLLRLSRVTRHEPVPEQIDLSEMAGIIVAELQKAKPRPNIRVTIKENMTVVADSGLMHNVLYNLLENSWKYTGNREDPSIEFGSFERDDRTIFYVRDNGEGFDMDKAGELFEPFRRLSTSHKYEGTGIGLSLVKRVVARHHGQIWAESEKGKGATFYFYLG
ncbi:MAG: PAS domain S-box protein [Chitinivibrionales bacterium]|nr:PAS domain S-box protein [Chitinivibrionales bacterium]